MVLELLKGLRELIVRPDRESLARIISGNNPLLGEEIRIELVWWKKGKTRWQLSLAVNARDFEEERNACKSVLSWFRSRLLAHGEEVSAGWVNAAVPPWAISSFDGEAPEEEGDGK